jgi:hypothetical protein
MKNIIIVILLLAAFGVGGLYLKKRLNDKEKEDNAGTKVIDRKGKKPPKPSANKPTPKKETPKPAAAAADAGAAKDEAKKEEGAKKEEPKKEDGK